MMSTDASYDVLVPLAMRHLGSGPAVLQEPAASAIVALMRAMQKPYQRTEILCRLLREYAQAPSCHRRLAFLNAAAAMQARYSTRCAPWPHGLRHRRAVHVLIRCWPKEALMIGGQPSLLLTSLPPRMGPSGNGTMAVCGSVQVLQSQCGELGVQSSFGCHCPCADEVSLCHGLSQAGG